MLYCRLIYMLAMLYVRLTIKVKVGIPESFKVGWYPPKITGSSHLKRSIRMTDGSKNAIVSWLLNFRIHVFEKRSKEEGEAPDQKSLSFAFSILVYSRKTLHESSKIFVGYSFQPTPNSCVLATAGSTMTIGLSINRCLQLKKKTTLTRQNKINQSKNFSYGDLKGLTWFRQSFLFSSSAKKTKEAPFARWKQGSRLI